MFSLWNGTFTSIILALNPAIQLGVYEMLKRRHYFLGLGENGDGSTSTLETFVNALVAKFVSTIVTYPVQVMQTRHRAGVKDGHESLFGGGPRRVLRQLYRGLESKLLQTCLNSALMFVAYERLVEVITFLISDSKGG